MERQDRREGARERGSESATHPTPHSRIPRSAGVPPASTSREKDSSQTSANPHPTPHSALRTSQSVLTIAGSDSGGGAGIQMDLQVFRYFGLHGVSVLTALTSQDSVSVHRVHHVPPRFVEAQIDAVMADFHPVAAKTGMLGRAQVVSAIAARLKRRAIPNLVVDPAVAAKDGTPLLSGEGLQRLKRSILAHALVVTPNVPEAEVLTGVRIDGRDSMDEAAEILLRTGVKAVILKGGHRSGDPVDTLWHAGERWEFPGERVPGTPVHGTGCLYSAALASRIALGDPLPQACEGVKRWMTEVIARAVVVGRGNRCADLSRLPSWDSLGRCP